MKDEPIKVGTRSSRLARIQTESALSLFREKIPGWPWETAFFSSPGDRDKQGDLLSAPGDFFTCDLDEALLNGAIDCAVHSAKDLPEPLPAGIDFFWLPSAADPRDVWVGSQTPKVIGISSARRAEYAKRRFPKAEIKPLRGNIEERLAQLDDGIFNALIMAAAALQRLDLESRIAEWIPPEELPVPEGQGALAVTFRSTDKRFACLRSLFVRPVVFVGAGTGDGLCTQAGVAALRRADACLYDALMDDALLNELPASARKIYVGKRRGRHRCPQSEINEMLGRFARQGRRVVRLKGGDAGFFGRLAEELAELDALHLPYRVVPGVSSLFSATTGSGLLLTRRGVADRVRIVSGHSAESSAEAAETEVIFMGTLRAGDLARERIASGSAPETPVSVVFSAGLAEQKIISGTLETIAARVADQTGPPGLILIGPAADGKFLHQWHGALRGMRVWLTCSAAIQERAAQAVLDFGGIPVRNPLIELVPETIPDLEGYDWVIVTSPSAVRCLVTQLSDLRDVPNVLCCGQGTAATLAGFRIRANAMPSGEFSTEGVLKTAMDVIPRTARILRLRSDRAGETLARELRRTFPQVDDAIICRNRPVRSEKPECDAVFFASVSAVESFLGEFGADGFAGKQIVAIGPRDAEALRQHGVEHIITPRRATVEEAIEALAISRIEQEMMQ